MPRFALGLEYDGTDFVGWQSQANGRSVQAALETAISRVADAPTIVHGAGRTDAGVHASGQVAHFDSAARRSSRQWLLGINANLPDDVAVQWVAEVPSTFDARRSALWRAYSYRIESRPSRPALSRRAAWWVREPLDCAAMTAAASYWLGEHDFSALRAANCQSRTPMRRFMGFRISRPPGRFELEFRANAFLYHMVRNMVGVLVEIGRGRADATWARELLLGRDRRLAGPTAPPQGLTLVAVAYPAALDLPASVA